MENKKENHIWFSSTYSGIVSRVYIRILRLIFTVLSQVAEHKTYNVGETNTSVDCCRADRLYDSKKKTCVVIIIDVIRHPFKPGNESFYETKIGFSFISGFNEFIKRHAMQ
jgi:hypothetical protein